MSFHFFGIAVAAIVCFVFGGMWYSPMLFAKAWAKESGTPDEHNPEPKAQARFFVILLALLVVAATVLDYILNHWAPGPALARGFTVGLMGGSLAAAVVAMDTLFERKSLKLFFINAGYYVVSFCITGLILSLF